MTSEQRYPLLVTEAELALLSRLLADEALDATLASSFAELWDAIVLAERVAHVSVAIHQSKAEVPQTAIPDPAA
jgi:hypothetical protein